MGHQFRIAPGIDQWADRLTGPLQSAWRGRAGTEARRMLGKIGFWVAQPALDAACQRQLVAFRRSRRDVADVATSRKRVELQIAELERQAGEPDDPARQDPGADRSDITEQLAELRRQDADLRAGEEQVTAVSRRLMAEINALRAGKEAIRAAYMAAEEAARAVPRR
jgi:hypothetical protein